MEATKLFDSHRLLSNPARVCWIAMLVLVFSIVGCPLALYLNWPTITQARPNQPRYRLHSVSCTGKGQVTFQRAFVWNQRRSERVDLCKKKYLGSPLIDFVSQQVSVLGSHREGLPLFKSRFKAVSSLGKG